MMNGMTRLAMGLTLAVTLSLALLLTFLLFLLANLFCSLIFGNKKRRDFKSNNTNADTQAPPNQPLGPLSFPFYGHGVLKINSPASKFLLSVPNLEAATAAAARQYSSPSLMVTDDLVYISNPMYGGQSESAVGNGDDEIEEVCSPPLKLMKKLPSVVVPKANSTSMVNYEGRQSLGASTETNYRPSSCSVSSSMSSNSLCSSPAW